MFLKALGRRQPWVLVVLLLMLLWAGAAYGQGTSFTYQGRLMDGGTPANGSYDLQFTLWDAVTGGTQQPQNSPLTVTRSAVAVSGGVFTVRNNDNNPTGIPSWDARHFVIGNSPKVFRD